MVIKEIKQDLFELDEKYALAHCISLDCAMGAGIAKTFDKKYPKMKQFLLDYKNKFNMDYPNVISYNRVPNDYCNPTFIFNLITKKKYWNKPTYETITSTIKQLALLCDKANVKYLAMPLIGCGLDKLKWDKVRPIIEEAFKDSNVEEILVCKL